MDCSKSICDIFESWVKKKPDGIALSFNNISISYLELNEKADRLAAYLISSGILEEKIVGLCLDRSVELIVAVLAVLKTGAAYLPLDPAYPQDRLKFMIEDTSAPFLITQNKYKNIFSGMDTKTVSFESIENELDQQADTKTGPRVSGDSLAYIMYTSGSTGQPKGIEITHGNILNLVMDCNYVKLDENQSLFQYAPISFDASTFEIWGALLNGGKLVICPPGNLLPEELGDIIKNNNITTAWLTTVLFNTIVDNNIDALSTLKQVLTGGEVMSPRHARKFFQSVENVCLINCYGPTENTVFTSCYPMTGISQVTDPVPIGKPINNRKMYILDKDLNQLPVDSSGELYTSGEGVARGYYRKPELTRKAFIKNPFSTDPDSRLYKTGDLAKYLPDGNIQYLGRIDNQVKIRGFRIEPGEIEACLLTHLSIKKCAVIAREDQPGDTRLVAYYVVTDGASPLHDSEVRSHLHQKLPDYMMPNHFISMIDLPITPNGKTDRKALPAPDGTNMHRDVDFVGPRTELEEQIAAVWREVLGIEKISIKDNFFEIGGHSLLAVKLISILSRQLGVHFPLATILSTPTIEKLAQTIEKSGMEIKLADKHHIGGYKSEIVPFPRQGALPLSSTQLRLWYIDQLSPGSSVYNLPFVFNVYGKLDINCLKQSIHVILNRHESFRTVFCLEQDSPVQIIKTSLAQEEMPVVDYKDLDESEREHKLKEYLTQTAGRPFDLSKGPLFMFRLIQMSDEESILFFMPHHIIFDGLSFDIFRKELFQLYNAFVNDQPMPLADLTLQYADYAAWQQKWMYGEDYKKQLAYWSEKLSGKLPVLQMPADFPRPAVMSFCGAREEVKFPEMFVDTLLKLGQAQNATLFMTLLSSFYVLLYRYTGQDDICIGSPVAGRTHDELNDIVGFFANTLVYRTHLQSNLTFSELLRQVTADCLDAFNHQDMPLEKLVQELKIERDLSTTPLYQAMFVFAVDPDMDTETGGLSWHSEEMQMPVTQTDLSLQVTRTRNGLSMALGYNTQIFKSSTIVRMLDNFKTLLEGILANPEEKISCLPLITESESQKLLNWNAPDAEYPSEKCLHHLFESWVKKKPDGIALSFNDISISYLELNEKADRLAAYLISSGILEEKIVGLCLDRSVELIVAVLAVLKTGAAYLPLDPAYPQDRLKFMIEDTSAPFLITQNKYKNIFSGMDTKTVSFESIEKELDQQADTKTGPRVSGDSLAYIMYTSGSTGQPKGIEITHGNILNLVINCNYVNLDENQSLLQYAPISFDASTFEIWAALLNGGKLVICPPGNLLPEELGDIIKNNNITTAWLTTVLFNTIVDNNIDALSTLKQMLTGGDVMSPKHARKFFQSVENVCLINGYGPTENTVFTCCYPMTDISQVTDPVPIGKPINNRKVYILDKDLNQLPAGLPGELYTSGDGVARGYYRKPELTRKAFIKNPFSTDPDSRLYKTGDLAKYLPDGNVQYLGRIDNQVKVRGFRIELGEIEACLRTHMSVEQCIVTAREDQPGDARLVAYYVVADQGPAPHDSELRSHLHKKLPNYMIPNHFICMADLPMTSNGKIDRKALPAPDGTNMQREVDFIEPRTELEEQIAAVWREVLGIEKISIKDNFFEIGGHSLLAVTLISKLSKLFGINFPLAILISSPSIEHLSLAMLKDVAMEKGKFIHLVAIQPNGNRPPLFCMHAIGGNVLNYYAFIKELGEDQPLYGLQARGLDGLSEPYEDIKIMAEHYILEMRQVQPHGPYYLCGGSMGGLIAIEVAIQLKQAGEKIAFLGMFDTFAPCFFDSERYKKKRLFSKSWFKRFLSEYNRNLKKLSIKEKFLWISDSLLIRIIQNFKFLACSFFRISDRPMPYSLRYWYVEQKHMKPAFTYTMAPYDGDLILFSSSLNTEDNNNDMAKGWQGYITGKLDIIEIPASHHEFIAEPLLSEKLSFCLKKTGKDLK